MVLLGGAGRTYVDTVIVTGTGCIQVPWYTSCIRVPSYHGMQYKFIVYKVDGTDKFIAYVYKDGKCIGRKDCNYPQIGAFPPSTSQPCLGPGAWHHDTYS